MVEIANSELVLWMYYVLRNLPQVLGIHHDRNYKFRISFVNVSSQVLGMKPTPSTWDKGLRNGSVISMILLLLPTVFLPTEKFKRIGSAIAISMILLTSPYWKVQGIRLGMPQTRADFGALPILEATIVVYAWIRTNSISSQASLLPHVLDPNPTWTVTQLNHIWISKSYDKGSWRCSSILKRK